MPFVAGNAVSLNEKDTGKDCIKAMIHMEVPVHGLLSTMRNFHDITYLNRLKFLSEMSLQGKGWFGLAASIV